MAKKKDKKVMLWAVVNLDDGFVMSAATRQDARENKYKGEKILRIEIKNGQPVASFVR